MQLKTYFFAINTIHDLCLNPNWLQRLQQDPKQDELTKFNIEHHSNSIHSKMKHCNFFPNQENLYFMGSYFQLYNPG